MNRDDSSFLRRRWFALAKKYSRDESLINSLFSEIESAYGSPGRHYHNLSHITYLLNLSEQFNELLQNKQIVDFAIFYHDFVYDVSRSDNEARSAAIAKDRLTTLRVLPDFIASVVQFIIASETHHLEYFSPESDIAWFLDFDMSILGGEWNHYRQYIEEVRKEYITYPHEVYAAGRSKFLLRTMSMSFIFNTSHFRTTYEQQARLNMERELALLVTA